MPKAREYPSAIPFMPEKHSLAAMKKAAMHCHGCPLYKNAQQTVFGEGKRSAKIIIIGEIPGEKEDEIGKPFVGPAGKLLRQTLEDESLNLEDIYLTNVVKHFKFEYLRHRKLHRSPNGAEIRACMPWLDAQIDIIQPKAILCLGLTAAKALIDKKFNIRKLHGKWFTIRTEWHAMATFHPSAILRSIDRQARHEMKRLFTQDIKKLRTMV